MDIHIQSLLRREDGTFIPVHAWEGPVIDSDYMEGALDLTVHEVSLITPSMWDYIDQLWAYILNVLEELSSSESTHTYFPDQPIKLEVERIACGLLRVSISSRSGKFNNSIQVQESQFARKLIDEGESFFLRMQELNPGSRGQYEMEVEKCKNLRLAYSN
jgi:hypothetical protein